MATWTQSQISGMSDRHYEALIRTMFGQPSEAEIEEGYVALARAILAGEPQRFQAA